MRFDPPPVGGGDIPIDGVLGDSGEAFFPVTNTPCNGLRALIVEESPVNFSLEGIVMHDLHALILGVLSSYVRLVVCFFRIIPSPHPVALEFLRDGVRASPQESRGVPDTVSFFSIPAYFPAVALRELPPCFVFFIRSFSHF